MASIKQYEVVIVTYKRPGDLFEVLTNLSEQTLKPSVVNIVDNDLEGSAKKIVELFQLERGMRLNYLINSTNSLTQGRNLGISIVSSPFVGLLDDDIIIPADYFEKSVNFLQANSDVAGVQGCLNITPYSFLRKCISFISRRFYTSKSSCKVFRSISGSYVISSGKDGEVQCEWISGSNQVYKSEVLRTVMWDQNLIGYCDGEDIDHSYRVHRSGLGKLVMLQALKIHHKESEISRTQDLTRKAMQYSYFIYLNYKLFPKGVVPRVIMFWSMFCDLMLTAVKNMIFHPKQRRFQELVYICMAYWIAFRNFRDLQKGDLQKFNIYISQMPLRLK